MVGAKDYIACYMADLRTGEVMEFEVPEELSEDLSASYDQQTILGRAGSIKGYNNTSDITLSFTLKLHDDYCKWGIVRTVNFIKSQLYPEYDAEIVAPKTMFRCGSVFSALCVLTSVSVTWKKPYRDGHYISADVSITIETINNVPPSASEILSSEIIPENTSSYYIERSTQGEAKVSKRFGVSI